MHVPDYIPLLRSGVGVTPADGGCLMQVANWFADPSTWTDGDGCVAKTLASYGITLNDTVSDEYRQQLALLIPRLIGTRTWDSPSVRTELVNWINDEHPYVLAKRSILNTYLDGFGSMRIVTTVINDYIPQSQAYQWYSDLIDKFDQITGRTEYAEITEDEWRSLGDFLQRAAS